MPAAVIFDLDGVLMDSEQRWNGAKESLVREAGGTWRDEASRTTMGMSSPEWAAYLRDTLGVPMEVEAISRDVVGRMEEGYRRELPLLPGAAGAVRALADAGRSDSPRRRTGRSSISCSSSRGSATPFGSRLVRGGRARQPAPDVYLAPARGLGVDPASCVAIEDSSSGLRAAAAAQMTVIAVPNPHYPPDPDALALAAASVAVVGEVTPSLVERLDRVA